MPRQLSSLTTEPIVRPLPEGPAWRLRSPMRRTRRLPAAVGFALLLLAGSQAEAGDILRGGATLGQRGGKGSGSGGPLNAAAEQARVNARDVLARTTSAMNS